MPGRATTCFSSNALPDEPVCFVPDSVARFARRPGLSERDVLLTLFDLGRQVASVIDLDDLLQRLPELIGRIIQFDAFAIYLLDERRSELRIAYAVGYPDTSGIRLHMNEGLVGRVIASEQALVLGDVRTDPGYLEVVAGMASASPCR